MSQITTLLVGMHFRPPAKQILESLPAGTALRLVAETENPYDANAIRVEVDSDQIPHSQHDNLAVKLPGAGYDLEEVLGQATWQLGYVAASGGKPLLQSGLSAGTLEIGPFLTHGPIKATLGFMPDGKPTISFEALIASLPE